MRVVDHNYDPTGVVLNLVFGWIVGFIFWVSFGLDWMLVGFWQGWIVGFSFL